jgi:acyl-coenzyme A synthetase/AMP-(fatty) acid ligase
VTVKHAGNEPDSAGPARIEWAEALPGNPSGKVPRRRLRKPYWQDLGHQLG